MTFLGRSIVDSRASVAYLVAIALGLSSGCSGGTEDRLVVYCAHDSVFSEPILREFERRTGIAVDIVPDTEAAKSLGLVNRIVREAAAPRCDVFWNNEVLGTMDLAERGLLASYKGTGYEWVPARYKDAGGRWCGFAGRLRVWIVNTEQMRVGDAETAFRDRPDDFTYAKPLFGTTLTHYCVLRAALGEEGFRALDARLREKATRAASNGQTRDLVASGTCAFGWTDTDDYVGAADAGKPVEMAPVTVGGETICVPNSVGIVQGTRRRAAAERLVDYLLSEEVELALARSPSRQIPLGPVAESELPAEVRNLRPLADRGCDLSRAFAVRDEVLRFLTDAYAQ